MPTTTAQLAAGLLAAGLLALPPAGHGQDATSAPSSGSKAGAAARERAGGQSRTPAGDQPQPANQTPPKTYTRGQEGGEAAESAAGQGATASPPVANGPISASIERHAAAVVRAHADPCARAGSEGKPCFPVSVEEQDDTFSVRDALRDYEPDLRPAPGVPTTAEIQQQMSGAPASASGGVSGDPVCGVKSLIRVLSGESNTFFLYRLTRNGEARPLLSDRKLDVLSYAAAPGAQLEFVGEYTGVCAAMAEWRKALRKSREGTAGHEPQPDRPRSP